MNKNDNTLVAGVSGGEIEKRHEGKRELIDPFILPPDYKPGAFSHSVKSGCSKHEKQDGQNSVKALISNSGRRSPFISRFSSSMLILR